MGRWGRWESSEVARWKRWENGEAKRWQVPGFIQRWGTQDETKFHLFVFDVNQGNEGMAAGMKRLSLDLSRAVKNIVGCGSVWNL